MSSFIGLVAKSCPILCDPMDCSPPRLPVHWISQARKLERIAIPSPGDIVNSGIELNPYLLHWQADSLPLSHNGSPFTDYKSQYKKWIYNYYNT